MTELDQPLTATRKYWFDKDHDKAALRFFSSDFFRNFVTILAVVSAVISLAITNGYQNRNIEFQREVLNRQINFQVEKGASDAWVSYREIDQKFPEFSSGEIDYTTLDANKRIAYYSLFERLLMSGDLVTMSLSADYQWRDAFIMEFRKHKKYILSSGFLSQSTPYMADFCTYRVGLRKWISEAFLDDPVATRRINAAAKDCESYFKSHKIQELP